MTGTSDDKKNDAETLDVQYIIEKLKKRTHEREQENCAQIPDLRPVVVANDYYESTSTSEHSTSGVGSPKRNTKKKQYSHVSKNPNESETTETMKNIVNNIGKIPLLHKLYIADYGNI